MMNCPGAVPLFPCPWRGLVHVHRVAGVAHVLQELDVGGEGVHEVLLVPAAAPGVTITTTAGVGKVPTLHRLDGVIAAGGWGALLWSSLTCRGCCTPGTSS